MKFFYWFALFLIPEMVQAQALTVTDIRVSETADSSASAREKALERAHDLAFERLVSQDFPEVSAPLPSHNKIVDMVTNFSIDREKTTAKSYTASFTFQFDDGQVQAWVLGAPSEEQERGGLDAPFLKGNTLKISVSYDSFPEWQKLKNELENTFGIQKVVILSLSPKVANLEVTYADDVSKFQHLLQTHGLVLVPQNEGWSLSRDHGRRL